MVTLNVMMMAMDMEMTQPGSARCCAGTGRLQMAASSMETAMKSNPTHEHDQEK